MTHHKPGCPAMSVTASLAECSGDEHGCASGPASKQFFTFEFEEQWRRLSDGERLALMGMCCRHCGTLTLPCYCGPEYDA